MSHFTVYRICKINGLTEGFLIRAVEFWAKQLGAQIFYGKIPFAFGEAQKVVVGFQTEDMRSPIGFKVTADGGLQVCGDSYMQQDEFAKYKMMAESGVLTNSYLVAQKAKSEGMTFTLQVQETQVHMEVDYNA